MRYALILIAMTTFAVGCTSTQNSAANSASNADAEAQLAQTAVSVSQALSELAAVSRATTPAPKKRLPSPGNYPGMNSPISIDWSGPVGPLVKRIAEMSGYRLRVLGRPPAIPVVVTIAAKNAPVADVLRDIAFQSGSKANIYILPSANVIELRYT